MGRNRFSLVSCSEGASLVREKATAIIFDPSFAIKTIFRWSPVEVILGALAVATILMFFCG